MASREIVDRAVATGLITAAEAPRFLDPPPPMPKLAIVPRIPPPPERLVLGTFRGRVVRGRARLTRALIAGGVVDREAIDHKATPRAGQHDQEDTA